MIDFLYNANGRISRKGYVLGYFLPMLLLTQILPVILMSVGLGLISMLIGLFYIWPSNVAVPVRRFHDLGASGWYQAGIVLLTMIAVMIMIDGIGPQDPTTMQDMISRLTRGDLSALDAAADPGRARLGIGLAGLVNLTQIGLFAFVPGQRGRNRFGDDPLASGRGFAD